jgi:hypothetical protein
LIQRTEVLLAIKGGQGLVLQEEEREKGQGQKKEKGNLKGMTGGVLLRVGKSTIDSRTYIYCK